MTKRNAARAGASLLAVTLFALGGCSDDAVQLGEPESIECPAAPGSQAPNLAVGLDGKLYLSWIEPSQDGHALRFSTLTDGGWSTPRTVAHGGAWFVNWADFPSIAALEDGTLAAHWLVRSGPASYAYDVHVALSRDGGTTWSASLRPHRDATETEHGFVSLVARPEGNFGVLWLEGRDTSATTRGAMTLRYATLRPDGELGDEIEVDDRVCDCCSTDAVRTGDGGMLVVYRDRTATEVRDISASRLEGSSWSSPLAVHADRWEIAACPVNGPAVAGRQNRVVVAWFTAARDVAAVQVAFSDDGGRTFDRPIRVDHGDPLGRVDAVLLDDGSALVSWLERGADQARLVLRQVIPSGALRSTTVTSTSQARSSGFPRMVRSGSRIILAWTQTGDPSRIATVALSM